jgi:peptide/nickel transport system substrate-binding protein
MIQSSTGPAAMPRRAALAAASAALLAAQAAARVPFARVALGRGEGGTFVYARGGDPANFDPAIEGPDVIVTEQIFETLVTFDGASTNIKPALARSWDVSPDGLTYTFALRQDVRFHDGTPFDAAVVKWNFDRWSDASNPYHTGTFLYWDEVAGFDETIQSVDVVDPATVQITLSRAQAPFLLNLALFAFAFASPTAVMAGGENAFRNPVGTGPFRFVEAVPGDRVVLERNPDYWGEMAHLDRVVVRAMPDNSARYLALLSGSADMMEGANAEDVAGARRDPALAVILRPSLNVGYLGLNLQAKPFDDLRVRQAVAAAINRPAIVESLYGNTGIVATQLIPPSLLGWNSEVKGPQYDPQKAKQLLAQAGLSNGFATELWYMPVSRPYFPDPKVIGEAIAADLAKVGITAALKTEDWITFLANRSKGKYPIYMLGWTGDNGDTDNFLYTFFGAYQGENTWDNAQVRDMLLQAQVSADSGERADLYRQVNALVDQQLPRIPVAHTTPPLIARSYVKGFIANPTAAEFYNTVWLDK